MISSYVIQFCGYNTCASSDFGQQATIPTISPPQSFFFSRRVALEVKNWGFFQELHTVAIKLANHAIKLTSLGFGTTFLEWVASYTAI
ncbi:hypothetical protein L1049_010302 [Liquidambar formosana]|uniref:Uncharacterized protein n=1 Tax=Liquidambar formosana TaxID=63359 RepID=A0AAP0N7F4_LIQFO